MSDRLQIETTLQWLADRAVIGDLLHRYASSIDLRDWERFATCFTEDVEARFDTFTPGESLKGRRAVIAHVQGSVAGFDVTHHISTNAEITLNGDMAWSRSYLHLLHAIKFEDGAEHQVMGGWTTNTYVRTGEGWRIRSMHLTVLWTEGGPELFAAAQRRAELLG